METMAYTGEKPWHGLGNKLAPQQPIEVWRQQAGMDYFPDQSLAHSRSSSWVAAQKSSNSASLASSLVA